MPGNNFTGDSSCCAVWDLNNAALTTDSSPAAGGNGANTLTNDSVTADTTNKKEGDASATFNGSAAMSRTDAGLSTGFPCKNGDTTLTGTVCAWVRPTVAPNYSAIYSKFDYNGNKGSIMVRAVNPVGVVYRIDVVWGYGGGSFETFSFTEVDLTLNQWYHVGVTWDGINKTDGLHIRVWDDTGTTVYNSLYTPTNTMVADTSTVVLGSMDTSKNNPFTGNIDEVVVFNRRLSSDDIDAIRGGTYSFASYPHYTMEASGSLPGTDADLTTAFSGAQYTAVLSDDDTSYVAQEATGQYAIFEFKELHTDANSVNITWNGKTDIDPDSSTVYLQVYKYSGTGAPTWETLDDTTTGGPYAANTDFNLTGTVSTNIANYKSSGVMTFRVYQLAQ